MDFTTWRDQLLADPETARAYHALRRRAARAERLTGWMRRLPLVGNLAYTFWYLVLDEGDPRDGLAFSFLNDGIRPTLYHTWLSIRRRDTMIYPSGAPRNAQEAA